MINVAIVEDDSVAADNLEKYLIKYGKDSGEEFFVKKYGEPLGLLENYKADFDLIFFDIELPNMNGMNAVRKLREADPATAIVFVTNMARYAVEGYEVAAVDFIIKPVTYEILSFKMQRIMNFVKEKSDRKLKITIGSSVECIDVSKIKYIEVLNHKLTYHTTEKVLTAYGQLKKLEESLPSGSFSRCNNYCLVNLKYVRTVTGQSAHIGDEKIPVSEGKRKEFLRALADYLGGMNNV